MRYLVVVLITTGVICSCDGQAYITAMGLRMGTDFGISLQQKIIGRMTGEGIIASNPAKNQTTATALVQLHYPLLTKRANFYLGGGIHRRWSNQTEIEDPITLKGITAIAGAELTLGRLNISWDYKPLYHFNSSLLAFESETAVSLRYVFVKKIKANNKKRTKKISKERRKKISDKKKRKRQRQKDRRKK